MRHRFIGGAVFAAAAVLAAPATGRAQDPGLSGDQTGFYKPLAVVRGQSPADIGGLNPPVNSYPTVPIPTGASSAAGFYTAAEFVMLTQPRAIGNQVVAFRGLIDSTGRNSLIPGTIIGTGRPALTTEDFARTGSSPGYMLEIGYKFEDGMRFFASWMQLAQLHYKAGASLVPQYFQSGAGLADTYLSSQVYGFPPQFSGPRFKTGLDVGPPGNIGGGVVNTGFQTYGIWNGATVMNMQYTQRYQQADVGVRMPLLQTEYSRVYGIASGRFAWLFDRFQWYTLDSDILGISLPQDQAWYTNTLSERMYGPVIGCGHEVFLANQFSLSCDLTAGLLLGVVKERVKYKLETFNSAGTLNPIASKASYDSWQLVPNANANLNLQWYPTEGVQVRVGYQAISYFNTTRMAEPVGFNYNTPDPRYETQVFRLIHGFNVGIGLFF